MRSVALTFLGLACITHTSVAFHQASRYSTARSMKVIRMAGSFYDIKEKDADGKEVSFDKFKGKVVLGCNVASKCGYTASNYKLFSKLSQVPGLEIALFPCNQFGGQEPGSDAEVKQFCAVKGVEGANVFTKGDVNGARTRPTYKFVKEATGMGDIGWNFKGKFLVSKKGEVIAVKNEGSLESDIQKLLSE